MRTVIRPLVPRMEFGVCLLHRRTSYSILATFFFVLFISQYGFANITTGMDSTSMNCYSQVNVSLNYTGQFRLTVDRLSGMSNAANTMIVELVGRDEPILDCREVGQEVEFKIRDTISNLYCWGTILVEDKLPFEISCKDGTAPCIDGLNALDASDFIDITDNCQTLDNLNLLSSIDSVGDLYPTPSDTLQEIHRLWSVSDDNGTIRQCESIIYVLPLPLDSIVFPQDTIISCGLDPFDLAITGDLNYSQALLSDNCHIAVDTINKYFGSFDCGTKQKYRRIWAVSDWVNGVTVRDTQFIIVEDTLIATIVAPDQVTTFFDGCNPMVILDPPTDIIGACSVAPEADLYVKVDTMLGFAKVGDTLSLGIGPHRLIYTGYTACIDYLIPDTLDINIAAPTAPILVCDSSLNRAISIKDQDSILVLIDSAFASANVTSCIPFQLLARKVNPICGTDVDTFSKSLEFCLDEVCNHILIELIVEDSLGRRSDTCEVWIDVQENVLPTLELKANPKLLMDSSGMVTLDSSIILASFGDNSGVFGIDFTGSGIGMTGSGLGMTGSGIPLFKDGVFQKFTCSDTGSYHVEVTITDCSNNKTTKTTTLHVDGNGLCPLTLPVYTGVVLAYGVEAIEGVVVTAETGGYTIVATSDADGGFQIPDISPSQPYTLHAVYDDDWQSGITANDLALMQDYFLGITKLDEYQQYSADVNGSGEINTIDLVNARKIILGLDVNFNEISPWLFNRRITSGYQEPLTQVSGAELAYGGIPIVGMKRGDMDADAMNLGKSRSIEDIEITKSSNEELQDIYRLNLGEPSNIKALQLLLDMDPSIEILNIDSHMDVDVSINDNRLDILYYKSISDDALWVEVVTTKGSLENIFTISDSQPALSWNHKGATDQLKLDYKEAANYVLEDIAFQVYPNPTSDQITVQLNVEGLDRSLHARLMISDPLGRRIYNMPVNFKNNGSFISYVLPLPPAKGLYIATLWLGDEQRQLKIVKN